MSEFISPVFVNINVHGRVILKCICAGGVGEQVANFSPHKGMFIPSLTRA
jgi:hypothetical protein